MRWWCLLNARHPLWRVLGPVVVLATLAVCVLFLYRGPRPIKPKHAGDIFSRDGAKGSYGTVIEQQGQSRFLLNYETILGVEDNLRLQVVDGRLEEPAALWKMKSPAASRNQGIWTLTGPMDVEALAPASQKVLGKGVIQGSGPALRWEHGVWRGLGTLHWEDLEGKGKGIWTLPPGWRRELDGKFVADKGPVNWKATQPGGLNSLDADRLWVTLGFQQGQMENVLATLEDGHIRAQMAEMDPAQIRWLPPIRFDRKDGWTGDAEHGQAPRPAEGEPIAVVELKQFKAKRRLPTGEESLRSDGARWTPQGLRLEGNVFWEQPLDGERLTLRGPRVLMRQTAGGTDLPPALPVGEAWVEGYAVLGWSAQRTLSSPKIEAKYDRRTWRLLPPVYGKSEQGTFSAGPGSGNPKRWFFEGPIRANLTTGGTLRGDQLLWENSVWTFTGRPATWTRVRERLSGPKIIRRDEVVLFPEGVHGALADQEGDIVFRADQGESRVGLVNFWGRVDCQGQGWSLQAERISVTLGPGDLVKQVVARGNVSLRGRLGEGLGEILELQPGGQGTRWRGKVRGQAEVAR